jgi:myo-inositol 2-dehydrogenase / D-chiro-inositol 1-dehydrogenase
MSRSPVALGLVGCGRLAEAGYVPAIAAASGVRLVAVADPEPARRAAVAALSAAGGADPVATFPDAAALLAGSDVDGLILATPVAAHLADAQRAAAAGVPVLVEKPPAADAAGAAALSAVSPRPWVAFNRRFDPGARAVRRSVPAAGPLDLRLEITYRRRSWGAHAVHDDALLDLGPHLVDWARWLSSGEAAEVACTELTTDRAALYLVLAAGRGRASLRAATDRPHAELIELRGASGQLVARHRLGGLVAAVRGRLGGGPQTLVVSLAGQLDAFAAAVRGEPEPSLGTAADGLAAMAVIDAARVSAATGGRPVPVPQPVET